MSRPRPSRTTRRLAGALGLSLLAAPLVASPGSPAVPYEPGTPSLPWFELASTYETSGGGAEIVHWAPGTQTLLYTDAGASEVGAVDVSDPANPGELYTVPVDGEPTSVSTTPDGATALTAVKKSGDNALVAFDVATGAVLREIPLAGEPDSVAITSNGKFAAIAIENEETPSVAGWVDVVKLGGGSSDPASWTGPVAVDVTGLAAIAPDDPEPEFVDTHKTTAVVTLQENNHIVLIDLPSASVIDDFSAGTATQAADLTEEDEIDFTESIVDSPLTPDGIAFSPKGSVLYTADEGEANFTGGRGFTLHARTGGQLLHVDDLERIAAQHSHYDDGRSANKGIEAENIDVVNWNNRPLGFVAAERGAFVAVYRLYEGGAAQFRQLLPTGSEPEGIQGIPELGLFVSANEADGSLSIFEAGPFPPAYPDVVSTDSDPIEWGSLSGLSHGPAGELYGVNDNAYAQSRIWTIDAGDDPAVITDELLLTDEGGDPLNEDLEGIATRLDGSGDPDPARGWWVVTEGGTSASNPNELYRIDPSGQVVDRIRMPAAIEAEQLRWGFEGVAVTGSGVTETVYLAVQRNWVDDPDDATRIMQYDVTAGTWAQFHYPLDVANPADDALVHGLSEIVAVDDTTFQVIERDSRSGSAAVEKKVYEFSIAGVTPTPCGALDSDCPVDPSAEVTKTLVVDLLATFGFDREKIEGLTTVDGTTYVVNDNDGFGETRMVRF